MKRTFIFIFFAIAPVVFVIYPFTQQLHGKMWFADLNIHYYFNSLSRYSPFYLWRESQGESYIPYLFNFQYYWPMRILVFLTKNANFSYIVYSWFIMSTGIFCFGLYMKKLFQNKISTLIALILGVVYINYFPLHYELINLKVTAAFTPLGMWAVWIVIEHLEKRRYGIVDIMLTVLFTVLGINFAIFDARGFLFYLGLICIQIIYTLLQKDNFRSRIRIIFWSLTALLGLYLLVEPVQYAWTTFINYSTHISTQTQESVLTYLFSQFAIFLHPRPLFNLPAYGGIVMILMFCAVCVGLVVLFKMHKPVAWLLAFFFVSYYVLINGWFLSTATFIIPHGQIFRAWYIAQSVASFIIPIGIGGLFLKKNKYLSVTAICLISLYVFLSYAVYTSWIRSIKVTDLDPYNKANAFLDKDKSEYKILWTPEMGSFGNNTSPYWAPSDTTGQGFLENMSSQPSYMHYYERMTSPYLWLASGIWESELIKNNRIDELLNIIGVKYLLVHDDVPGYHANTLQIQKRLQTHKSFKLVYKNEYVYVYQNMSFKSRIWTTKLSNASYCDHGFSCLSSFFKHISPYQSTTFLTDVLANKTINQNIYRFVLAQKDRVDENYYNLLVNSLLQNSSLRSLVLFSKDYLANQKFSSCLSDTHHALYHTYFPPNMAHDYAYSFEYQNCFFALSQEQPQIRFIVDNVPEGDYVMMVRYFQYAPQQSFIVGSDTFSQIVSPQEGDNYKNGYVYRIYPVHVPANDGLNLQLSSTGSTNLISLIAFVPKSTFDSTFHKLSTTLSTVPMPTKMIQPDQLPKYHRINPTEWSVDLDTNHPVILNFAESHNPFWKAVIYKNKKIVSEQFSSPGDGIINSFIIKETGSLHVKIIFDPQTVYDKMLIRNAILSIVLIGLSFLILRKL